MEKQVSRDKIECSNIKRKIANTKNSVDKITVTTKKYTRRRKTKAFRRDILKDKSWITAYIILFLSIFSLLCWGHFLETKSVSDTNIKNKPTNKKSTDIEFTYESVDRNQATSLPTVSSPLELYGKNQIQIGNNIPFLEEPPQSKKKLFYSDEENLRFKQESP